MIKSRDLQIVQILCLTLAVSGMLDKLLTFQCLGFPIYKIKINMDLFDFDDM